MNGAVKNRKLLSTKQTNKQIRSNDTGFNLLIYSEQLTTARQLWSYQGVRSEAQSRVTGKILQSTGTRYRPCKNTHGAASYCQVYKHLQSGAHKATHDILASAGTIGCIVANSAEEAKIRRRYEHATSALVSSVFLRLRGYKEK